MTKMRRSPVDDLEQFVDAYVAMWNEPDPDSRRKIVADLWAPDAVNFTAAFEARGREAIEARVTRAYDTYVGTGSHTFRLARPAAAHHGAVRVDWEMVTAGGEVASTGTELLMLDCGGLIASDHQFLTPG
jgi:uncharacterized protein